MSGNLVISTSQDMVCIAPEKIVYISSDGNYSTLMQADGMTRIVTYQLGQIEKMIKEQIGTESRSFLRVGKGLIINRSYVYYVNIPKQLLILSDASGVIHTTSASREALKRLKSMMEERNP